MFVFIIKSFYFEFLLLYAALPCFYTRGCFHDLNPWPYSHMTTTLPVAPRLPLSFYFFVIYKKEKSSQTDKLSITRGNNNISGYSIKNNSMCAATITEYVGIRKGKTRWWHIYPLRKYAFDREGFNSIALFASATASEQKSRNLVAKISKSLQLHVYT